jgi:hypothetical protein
MKKLSELFRAPPVYKGAVTVSIFKVLPHFEPELLKCLHRTENMGHFEQ